MLKRIFLFVLTNILVVVTISIVLQVLGVQPYLTANGIDYQALLIFCLVWGMGGAFISLQMSRLMAKWMLGVQVIKPGQAGQYESLYRMVEDIAKRAGLPKTPEVGIYESPEVNAFATGPSKSRSLVAVSTGLLGSMSRNEVEGVIAHEVAHIQNGDMVTMTLIQGVVNAFVMFFARAIAYAASMSVKEEQQYWVRFLVTIVLEILLSFLGLMVVAWFSRKREFAADRGGAQYAGRQNMVAALEALVRRQELAVVGQEHASMATLKISSKPGGLLALMSTHPPLEQRIAALKQYS